MKLSAGMDWVAVNVYLDEERCALNGEFWKVKVPGIEPVSHVSVRLDEVDGFAGS